MKAAKAVRASTKQLGASKRVTTGSKKAAGRPEPRWKSEPAKTPTQYIAALPPDRKAVIERLRRTIRNNLPRGFEETIDYGMIGYVVPHRLYPAGYHCAPEHPVPFISLASQKQYVSFYHMGLYAGQMLEWFKAEWPKHTTAKLDMGKSCVRFRDFDAIPYDLIASLARRMTPRQWIALYEAARGNR